MVGISILCVTAVKRRENRVYTWGFIMVDDVIIT